MSVYLLNAADLWLRLERPDATVLHGFDLPCGLTLDVAAIEDGRICGIIFWTGVEDPHKLARSVIAAKAYLAEIWVLSSPCGVESMRGSLPLHVGFRVARRSGVNPSVAMPASVNDPSAFDLIALLDRAELAELAAMFGVPTVARAIVAAGRLLHGPLGFKEQVTAIIRRRSDIEPPSKIEILKASKPWSAVVPPVFAEG